MERDLELDMDGVIGFLKLLIAEKCTSLEAVDTCRYV
jgi:hypothetical protein